LCAAHWCDTAARLASGIIIIIEHTGTDIDPVPYGQRLEHGGGGVNDGRGERGGHVSASVSSGDKRGQHTSGIIIVIEHAGTDIDPVPYVRYVECRSNNLGSLYSGSVYLHHGPCLRRRRALCGVRRRHLQGRKRQLLLHGLCGRQVLDRECEWDYGMRKLSRRNIFGSNRRLVACSLPKLSSREIRECSWSRRRIRLL